MLTILGTKAWKKERSNIIIPNTSVCTVPTDQLIPIDRSQNICCLNNGRLTGAYYVKTIINNRELEMSVIPSQRYYVNVCREFCSDGNYKINTDGSIECVNNLTDTKLANNCVELLYPRFPDGTPCSGSALPVAILGINPLFALHVNTINGFPQCSVRAPC